MTEEELAAHNPRPPDFQIEGLATATFRVWERDQEDSELPLLSVAAQELEILLRGRPAQKASSLARESHHERRPLALAGYSGWLIKSTDFAHSARAADHLE